MYTWYNNSGVFPEFEPWSLQMVPVMPKLPGVDDLGAPPYHGIYTSASSS
jgi:hypothetical protein